MILFFETEKNVESLEVYKNWSKKIITEKHIEKKKKTIKSGYTFMYYYFTFFDQQLKSDIFVVLKQSA